MENFNTSQDSQATSRRCRGAHHRRVSMSSPLLDWGITDQNTEVYSDFDLDAELAGLLAACAGAPPEVVFACRVMRTVLSLQVISSFSEAQHHQLAEALALYEAFGDAAWAYLD